MLKNTLVIIVGIGLFTSIYFSPPGLFIKGDSGNKIYTCRDENGHTFVTNDTPPDRYQCEITEYKPPKSSQPTLAPEKTRSPDNEAYSEDQLVGEVVGITDGDTLKLLVDKKTYKIRLAEIDTPEKGQPYGSKSKKILSDMVFGKQIMADIQTVDRYGRTVARLYVGEFDVNAELVRQGAAWVYRKYANDQNLSDLEKEAKAEKRGLWSLPEAERIPPWEWRQYKRNTIN